MILSYNRHHFTLIFFLFLITNSLYAQLAKNDKEKVETSVEVFASTPFYAAEFKDYTKSPYPYPSYTDFYNLTYRAENNMPSILLNFKFKSEQSWFVIAGLHYTQQRFILDSTNLNPLIDYVNLPLSKSCTYLDFTTLVGKEFKITKGLFADVSAGLSVGQLLNQRQKLILRKSPFEDPSFGQTAYIIKPRNQFVQHPLSFNLAAGAIYRFKTHWGLKFQAMLRMYSPIDAETETGSSYYYNYYDYKEKIIHHYLLTYSCGIEYRFK